MILKIFLFIVAAAGGYVLAVVAAFVFWSWTGASGPDYTPLLVVLLVIAPATALICGVYAASRPLRRGSRNRQPPDPAWRTRWGEHPSPAREPPDDWPPGRPWPGPAGYGKWRIAIAVGGALLMGAFLVANKLANDRAPTTPHIPRISR